MQKDCDMSKYLTNDDNNQNDNIDKDIIRNKEIDNFQLEQANLNFKKILYIIEN